MTPPLNDEVEDNKSRKIEVKVCKILETKGCPLCYLIYLEIPLRESPKKY
jgi:hypothetical protein